MGDSQDQCSSPRQLQKRGSIRADCWCYVDARANFKAKYRAGGIIVRFINYQMNQIGIFKFLKNMQCK